MRLLEWPRMPGDLICLLLGVIPLGIAAVKAHLGLKK
jgi:hypothetical protein